MATDRVDSEATLGMVLEALRDVVAHDGGPVLTARLISWLYERPTEDERYTQARMGLRRETCWKKQETPNAQAVGSYLGRNRGRHAEGLRLDRVSFKRAAGTWSLWAASPIDAPVPINSPPRPTDVAVQERSRQKLLTLLEDPRIINRLDKFVEALSKKRAPRKPRKKQKVEGTTLLHEDEYTLLKAAHQRLGITRVSGVLGIRSESIRELLAIDRVTVRTAARVREGLPKLRSVLATTKPKVKRPKRVHLVLADDELRKKLIALKPFVSISQLSFVLSTRPLTVRSIISGYRKMHQSLLEDIRARVDLLLKPPYVDLRGALVVPSQQVLETLRLGFLPPLPGFTAAETERFVIDSTRDR